MQPAPALYVYGACFTVVARAATPNKEDLACLLDWRRLNYHYQLYHGVSVQARVVQIRGCHPEP